MNDTTGSRPPLVKAFMELESVVRNTSPTIIDQARRNFQAWLDDEDSYTDDYGARLDDDADLSDYDWSSSMSGTDMEYPDVPDVGTLIIGMDEILWAFVRCLEAAYMEKNRQMSLPEEVTP